MAKIVCEECGTDYENSIKCCPSCGCPTNLVVNNNSSSSDAPVYQCSVTHTDWAQYYYECAVIGWRSFKRAFSFSGRASRREFWSNFFMVSFTIWPATLLILAIIVMPLGFLIDKADSGFQEVLIAVVVLLPAIVLAVFFFNALSVSIRRMHDVDKCGWWCICPIASWFLLFKASDEGDNLYGDTNPAKNLL